MAISALVRSAPLSSFNRQHPILLLPQGQTNPVIWGCVSGISPKQTDLLGYQQTGGTSPSHVLKPYIGLAVDYTVSTSRALFAGRVPTTSTPVNWTFAGVFTCAVVPTNGGIVFIDNTAACGLEIRAVTGLLALRIGGAGAVASGFAVVPNVPYFAAASFVNNTTLNYVLLRLDTGAIQTVTTSGASAFTTSDGTIVYGSRTNSLGGYLAWAVAISEAASLSTLVAWAYDPWSIFARPTPALFAAPVAAGIAFDATSNSTYQTADASYTWNHTCTGANRYLVVTIAMLSVAGSSVSAITYNSVNLVFLGARATVSGTVRIEMWGLVAPATGTNVIAVTLSASLDSVGEAASFTGVHQTVSTEAFNTATGTATGGDASVTVTSVADNDWVVSGVASDDTAITIATGTQRQNVSGALGSGGLSTFGPQTPAGGVAMTWTSIGALASWAIAGVALRPIAASGLPSQGWGGLLAGWRNFLVGGGDDD